MNGNQYYHKHIDKVIDKYNELIQLVTQSSLKPTVVSYENILAGFDFLIGREPEGWGWVGNWNRRELQRLRLGIVKENGFRSEQHKGEVIDSLELLRAKYEDVGGGLMPTDPFDQ
ncbi:hypothetical protein EQG49_12325 [Periweissella cryptocerci]|uniref:Uncharacterized protein n=1 Tax=Periweissella cryptocerci TaxID=2506420 RepID=A0A4P6YWH4_9LACO|nr:hypothetical protein [Periweissella cryptocerci]QBO37184.1 hypothetical protein EQG49_12325 [Periweissella cryptocerci]